MLILTLLAPDGISHSGVRTFFWTYLRYFLNFSVSISMEKVGPKMSSSAIPIADVGKGLSQILCKHRNAVQIEQNLFKAEVAQAAAALFSK